MTILSIIIAIFVFGLIIAIHELGHFVTAKSVGIKVHEFAIGMGPKLVGFTKGDTNYSLRLIPFGGYCAMEGENEASDSPTAFGNKKVWQRIIVICAGAFMNLILGFTILLIMTSAFDEVLLTEKILGFRDNSTSSQKLQVGDEILKIDSVNVFTADDIQFTLMISKKDTFDVTVRRNGEKVKLDNVKFNTSYDYYYDDNGYLVKSTSENYAPQGREVQHYEGIFDFAVDREEKTPLKVLGYTFRAEGTYIQLIFTSLRELVTGGVSFRDMSGPVGIVSGISETVDQSINIREKIYNLLNITMLITINVGVFNLLPLPALDGGRLVFLIIEGVRRKKINPELEAKIHATGLALLMVLIVFITFNDVFNLFIR